MRARTRPARILAAVALAGTGLAAPDVGVAPDSLAAALETGQTTTLALTVSNTGDGPLTFAFDGFAADASEVRYGDLFCGRAI